MSPPSQGYESTRMVPECHSASQTSQHSSSHGIFSTHKNPVHHIYSTQPTQPKGMDPLICHTVPQVFHLLLGIQCIWSRKSMLGLSGFVAVRKNEHEPKHLRHAGLNSWMEYTSSLYIQKNHSSSPTICFPFPSQNVNEER
jgi:hypothetical protein